MTTPHPGDLAASKFAAYVRQRNESKAQRLRAADLRKEAKIAPLKADAYALRIDAKACSAQAQALRAGAIATKEELEQIIENAAKELRARLPAEFATWGVIKTRAYMKLLTLLSAQSTRQSPNLALTTTALQLMRDHATWTDTIFSKLAAIKGMPKELS